MEPIWKGYDLKELRLNPHYTAGYHAFPYVGKTAEDKAAFQLGKDEARLTKSFNLALF